MFEAFVAAVHSERAGDVFLCACALILLGAFILRYMAIEARVHVMMLSNIFTSTQVASAAKSSVVPSSKPTHRCSANAPRPSFYRPSRPSQTLAWSHFLGKDECAVRNLH